MNVEIVAPATTANLGPGFDCLGAALSLPLTVTTSAGAEPPKGLIGRALRAVAPGAGAVGLQEASRIPSGRGLGSSAAAVAAGLLLGCALTRRDPDPAELLRAGLPLEGHPDNLAPCLFGGVCLVLPSNDVLRFEPTAAVRPVVLVPHTSFRTAKARRAIPENVPHRDAVVSVARASGLLALLTGGVKPTRERLFECTEDVLHQPYRAGLMPESATVITALREEGVPAALSGAGPSVVCLLTEDVQTPRVEGWQTLELEWDTRGARMTVTEDG